MRKVAQEIVKKWLAPAAVGTAAATQSEDSDASFIGVLAKNANAKGAKAAMDVFEEHMGRNPEIFTNPDTLLWSGNMQSDAARAAGDSRQGWFVGADGHPRYEISDKNAAIDGNFTKGIAQRIMDQMPEGTHFPVPLGEFLSHDSLFNAYPEMKDIPVMLRHPRDFEGMAGYHAPEEGFETGGISMNLQPILDENRTESVKSLMHEVQHAIQNKEGWARGANFGNAIDDVKNYVEDPHRHGVVFGDAITGPKLEKMRSLLDLSKSDDPGAVEFADEMSYYMSAGEAEARAVENRLRMPSRLRNSYDGHPYGDMGLPRYMLPEDRRGPTLFQMIEMLTREQ